MLAADRQFRSARRCSDDPGAHGLADLDRGQADDKIIAVLQGDAAFGHCREISELPEALVERLKHYFLTYKQLPSEVKRQVQIAEVYDQAEAHEVIRRSFKDYERVYGPRTDAGVKRKASARRE